MNESTMSVINPFNGQVIVPKYTADNDLASNYMQRPIQDKYIVAVSLLYRC